MGFLLIIACNGVQPRAEATATAEEEPPPEASVGDDSTQDGAQTDQRRLRVATYNVNYGMAGHAGTIELISKLDADMIFLQETQKKWARALRRALAEQYPHMAFHSHSWPAGSLGVLSRYPIAKKVLIRGKEGPFPAYLTVVDSPLGKLQVLNVHLDPPALGSQTGGWIGAYRDSQAVHEREIAAHHERLDPELPTLVVGDFNEDWQGRAIEWLVGRGFARAIEEFTPTWKWKTRYGEVRWQLDHVLHDSRLRVLEARVVKGGRSDHQPVVAEIALAEPLPSR
jgi:endonuclease/exonuclease/phosphatase (EEP) superfamily protein YafD